MIPGKYILFDGVFYQAGELKLIYKVSSGRVFSSKIRSVRSFFPFFQEWLDILKLNAAIFNYPLQDILGSDGADIQRQMERTLTKNRHFKSAILTVEFFRSEDESCILVRSEKLEETSFEINQQGLFLELFDKARKPVSSLSNLVIGSELIWSIALSHLKNQEIGGFLLSNTNGSIVEVPGSSVFILKDNTVYYPDIKTGAYVDIICPIILKVIESLGFHCSGKEIDVEDLLQADEFFLVDSLLGIRWVIGFREKRYFNKLVKRINEELNRIVLIQ